MTRNLLTALEYIEERMTSTVQSLTAKLTAQTTAYQRQTLKTTTYLDYRKYTLIQVQRVTQLTRIHDFLHQYAVISETMRTRKALETSAMPFEFEELRRKGIMKIKEYEEEVYVRRELPTEILEPEKVTPLRLWQQSINLVDQQAFAMLEKQLWLTQPTDVLAVLQKLYDACQRKQLFIERIVGKEPLMRLLAQMYIPMFMQMPLTMNMMSLRVTPLTMQLLENKQGTTYVHCVAQGQAIKTAPLLASAQRRRTETKQLASAKQRVEIFPIKMESGVVTALDKEGKLYVGKDLMGKALMMLTLMYCTTIPYIVKHWLAHQWGMPQNYRLLRKPQIQFMPTRVTLAKKIRVRYTGTYWTNFNRDEYLKLIKKYGGTHSS